MKEVEDLARSLFAAADPSAVWAAIDECERLHWRRQAQEKLAAERYTKRAESL